MLEKSAKYSEVAAVEKDVAAAGRDVTAARKKGRKMLSGWKVTALERREMGFMVKSETGSQHVGMEEGGVS